MAENRKNTICFVSSCLPRECGIATFTDSMMSCIPQGKWNTCAIAITEPGGKYKYGKKVIAEIRQEDISTYRRAAELINNRNDISIVSLQHVFSLFGGENGTHILEFLKHLKKPVVTTMHMVYRHKKTPSKLEVVERNFEELTRAIGKYSNLIIVMIQPMRRMLVEGYDIDPKKIVVIPHGTPIQTFSHQLKNSLKKYYGYSSSKIISHFGLIRPKKGLEYVIRAMPKILESCPEAKLMILGEPHPNRPGEYYEELKAEAVRLGVKDQVIFKNGFLPYREIIRHLIMSDIFITPYLVPEQTSSGVLAYAMGCGKAIISTPFLYAKETLSNGRGRFVGFENEEDIARETIDLLRNSSKRRELEYRAYDYAKTMSWPRIGNTYDLVISDLLT